MTGAREVEGSANIMPASYGAQAAMPITSSRKTSTPTPPSLTSHSSTTTTTPTDNDNCTNQLRYRHNRIDRQHPTHLLSLNLRGLRVPDRPQLAQDQRAEDGPDLPLTLVQGGRVPLLPGARRIHVLRAKLLLSITNAGASVQAKSPSRQGNAKLQRYEWTGSPQENIFHQDEPCGRIVAVAS